MSDLEERSLAEENRELREKLAEATETLSAIKKGEVDALVVSTREGEQVYSISGAERPYRNLIERMQEGAVILSEDDSVLFCNKSFACMVGLSAEKVMGNSFWDIISSSYVESVREMLSKVRSGNEVSSIEVALQGTNDLSIPVQISGGLMLVEGVKTVFLVVTDLSRHMRKEVKRYTDSLELEVKERKKAEEALRQSEQRWATTLKSIGDAVIATDNFGNVTFMNKEAERCTGWSFKLAVGKSIRDVFHIVNEYSGQEVTNPIEKVLKDGLVVGLANHTILVRKDGTSLPIDDSGAPIRDNSGKISGVVLVFHDVSEQRRTEKALVYNSRRFELLSEITRKLLSSSAPQMIIQDIGEKVMAFLDCDVFFNFFLDEEKQKLRLNAYFGVPAETAKTFKWLSLGEAVCGCAAQQGERVICENIPDSHDHRTELVSSFGIKAYCANPIFSEGKVIGTLSFGSKKKRFFSQDDLSLMQTVTGQISVAMSRVRAEEALKQAQDRLKTYTKNLEGLIEERTKQLKDSERLAAIGATAGMVGHDIRNPLQAITSDVYLLKGYLKDMLETPTKKDAAESLDGIDKNVEYVNKIVQDLQDYTRKLAPVVQPVNIEEICERLVFNSGVPENISASLEVKKQVQEITTDPAMLKRVLTNLVNNAIQAMPGGGKLEVKVCQKNGECVFEVTDTGEGIPEEVKPKLFTPLFTTKSKGQGFGLAAAKRLVEALGGTICFESETGKGTKFIIKLPLSGKI